MVAARVVLFMAGGDHTCFDMDYTGKDLEGEALTALTHIELYFLRQECFLPVHPV